jgi:hypothetical protein
VAAEESCDGRARVLTTPGLSVILLGVMVPLAVRRYSRVSR